MENVQGTVEVKKSNGTGFKGFLANLVDQVVSVAIAGILELVFDFVIKFMGYQVSDKLGILLVMYIVVSCLYTPILENVGLGKNTIGKKIFKL